MRRRFLLLAALLLLAVSSVPAHGAAGPWEENPESAVRLSSPWAKAPAQEGGEIYLGLHFTTRPGWHVYWKNSGSAGFPPMVDFSATPEVAEAELLWPAPERYELPGDLVAFGYEGEVVYNGAIDDDPSGRSEIAQRVNYVDGALGAVGSNASIDPASTKPYGCSVKY